jgi:signal transduction histidine kinase
MNHSLKPASRLTIVFILAVILSGSVLTYFSINNISNQKELTENRIIEEQRELYSRFSVALGDKLEEVTEGLNDEAIQSAFIKDSFIKRAADYDFIIQPFILTGNGQFVYPNFAGIPDRVQEQKLSERYNSAFREGEQAEFAEKNFRKAEKYYLLCLNYSTGSNDSAKALNALGRIAVKINDPDDALIRYRSIVLNYSSVSDENGYPYVYYALPQLLKIGGSDNAEKILPPIEYSLEKLVTGSIPLNYYTEELLTLVTEWLKETALNNTKKSSYLNNLIENVNQQLQLITIYGNELADLPEKTGLNGYYSAGNDFKIINSFSGNNHEFFLINTDLDDPAGFLIDRDKLFDTLTKTDLQQDFNFDYVIEFPAGYFANNNRQRLIFSSPLNPYFPGQIIRIKLENEGLISNLVKRRSWIYGVASVLLLVAMLLGVALILRDIAREKHLARLRSDFISNVTHELKTPLTSIRMYAESLMMRRVKSDSSQREYLSVIVNESERLKRMINNILEFSKMERSRQEYHPVETNLSEILHKAILDMNYWLEEKEFSMITGIDQNTMAKVDPEKFHQVFTNLLSNAIKYSGDSRKIYVRLYKNSDAVITEVEDEGIGIAKDHLTKIFEEFYRVERQESGEITGTGLGLTVVKEIVEAHGGKILVDSEIGKGSKFTVRIPLHGT